MSEYCRFPMKGGEEYAVAFEDGDHYERMFPNINAAQEFCAMTVWLEANPAKRKTRRGIKRFIGNWLIRATREQSTPSRVATEAHVGKPEPITEKPDECYCYKKRDGTFVVCPSCESR